MPLCFAASVSSPGAGVSLRTPLPSHRKDFIILSHLSMKVWLYITDEKEFHIHSDRMVHQGWNVSLPPLFFLKCIFPQKSQPSHWSFPLDNSRGSTLVLLPQQVNVPWHWIPFLCPGRARCSPTMALLGCSPAWKGHPGHSCCCCCPHGQHLRGDTPPIALTRIQKQAGFFPDVWLLLLPTLWPFETLRKILWKNRTLNLYT